MIPGVAGRRRISDVRISVRIIIKITFRHNVYSFTAFTNGAHFRQDPQVWISRIAIILHSDTRDPYYGVIDSSGEENPIRYLSV